MTVADPFSLHVLTLFYLYAMVPPAALAPPPGGLFSSGNVLSLTLPLNVTVPISSNNKNVSSAFTFLPPEHSNFQAPGFPNTIISLFNFGPSLGIAGVDDIFLNNALIDAHNHDPAEVTQGKHYRGAHSSFLSVSRFKPDRPFTWGDMEATIRVLLMFSSNYEFVALRYAVIDLRVAEEVAYGLLLRNP